MEAPRPQGEHRPTVSTYHFAAKNGEMYHADFHHYEGAPKDDTRNNFAHPRFRNVFPQLKPFIRAAWPLITDAEGKHVSGYQESTVESTANKFDKFSDFALAYDNKGKLVAFNVYKIGETETKAGKAKIIYVEHAGTLPEVQRQGITQGIRNEFFRRENPDVICGSSANGVIYAANKKIAAEQNMVFYPTREETPANISELALQIIEELGITSAPLDDRLVRTYPDPVAASQIPHELSDTLKLTNAQHVFYVMIKPELNINLLAAK